MKKSYKNNCEFQEIIPRSSTALNPEMPFDKPISHNQDGERGGGKKAPPTIFPVIFTNVGISPQNFLTFSFNPFCHTDVTFRANT